MVGGDEQRPGRPTGPRAPAPRSRSSGVPGAHECTHGSAPASATAASTQPERLATPRAGATTRCRPKPDAVGTRRVQHGGQRGLVDLDDQPVARRAAGGARRRRGRAAPSASACARSRRAPWSASTLSPRGFSTVAASVHGPATWILNGAGVALRLLLDRVEVLGEQAAGPAVVDARAPSVSRQPAGCRSAPRSGHDASARPVIDAAAPAAGQLGQVRQVGRASSPSTTRTASAYVRRVVARAATRRPVAERHRERRGVVGVDDACAEPTTRVPS